MSPLNKKSGQEVAKQKPKPERAFAKTDARYWYPRVIHATFTRNGTSHETAEWCMRLAHAGRRETLNLRTANQAGAASKAATIYKQVVAAGWDAVLDEHRPKPSPTVKAVTIGDVIREVGATAGFQKSTFTIYAQSLRTVACGVAELNAGSKRATAFKADPSRRTGRSDLARYDSRNGGNQNWRQEVEATGLDLLTPENIQEWKLGYIARAGSAPDARRRAESSAISLLRNARALFSEKALRFVRSKLSLPQTLPFSGIKLEGRPSSRYISRITASQLIAAAQSELASDSSRQEQFKLFCLAMFCGLRKAEADSLLWRQVDLSSGQIRIEPTEYFTPKSEDSIGILDLDPQVLDLLLEWKPKATGVFVVESAKKPRYQTVSHRCWYRCEVHFKGLYAWLKTKGITARKPFHELRKEVGAILASEQGIFAAQRVLRHAQISTTAGYYADKKGRITAGLGSLLDGKTK